MLRFVKSVCSPTTTTLKRGLKPHTNLRNTHNRNITCCRRPFNTLTRASASSNTTFPGSKYDHIHRCMSTQTKDTSSIGDHPDIGDMDVFVDNNKTTNRNYEGAQELLSIKYEILQSFDKKISENVREVISIVDSAHSQKHQEEGQVEENGDSDHPVERRAGPRKNALAARWRTSVQREAYQQRRANRISQETDSSRMTAEDAWDEVMIALDLPYDETTSFKSPILSLGDDTNTLDDIMTSPILGLNVDEDGHFENLDGIADRALSMEGKTGEIAEEDPDEDLADIRRYFGDKRVSSDSHDTALRQAIAILSSTKAEEWKQVDYRFGSDDLLRDVESASGLADVEEESVVDDLVGSESDGDDESDVADLEDIYELLENLHYEGDALTTSEANLLLARLTTDTNASVEDILGTSLQIYREMVALRKTGRVDNGPDITTYRILLLALSRRLMAIGEAVKLGMEMIGSDLEPSSDALLNAMQACYRSHDIGAAERLMDFALENCSDSFRPSLGSYMLMLDMLKKNNSQKAALDLLKSADKTQTLSSDGRDKFLLSLCQWPRRTRRGDAIDTVPLLMDLMAIAEEGIEGTKLNPGVLVWQALVDRLAGVAKTDESMWPHINHVIRKMHDAHPDHSVGQDLLRIGVLASNFTADAKLGSTLIQKAVDEYISSIRTDDEELTISTNENGQKAQASIPHRFFRHSLETCLRYGDRASAKTVLESLEKIEDAYPLGVQAEIQALGVLFYTRLGKPDVAKEIVSRMVAKGMKPSESLFGAVLHSFAVARRREDATDYFQSIESDPEHYGITPNTSCYDAVLLAYVRSHEWDDAIEFHKTREEKGIPITPQAIQGLVLANYRKAGSSDVLSLLDKFVEEKAPIDDSTLQLLVKVLLPEFQGDNESFRSKVRKFADVESNIEIRGTAIELIRSIHDAQSTKFNGHALLDSNKKEEEPWAVVLAQFVRFVRASTGP